MATATIVGTAIGKGRRQERDAVSLLTLYLVLLLVVPAPMVIAALGQVGGPATLIALAAFASWCWNSWQPSRRHTISRLVRNAALGYLLVVLAAYAHSALLPIPPDERSPADSELIRSVGFVGLVCLMSSFVSSRDRLMAFVERVAQGMGVLGILAVLQTLTHQVIINRLSIPGLSPGLATADLQVRGVLIRPSGTSTHPIEFAAVLAMGLPLLLVVARREGPHRRVYIGASVLVALVVLMTGSRTSIVCGAIAFVAMLPAWPARTRFGVTTLVAALVGAMFVVKPGAVGTIRGLFQGASNDSSVKSRTNSYAIVQEFWERHIWIGRGAGTFLPKYWILDDQYLQVLLGAGVIGVVAIACLMGSAVLAATRAAKSAAAPGDRELAIAARASVLAGAGALALFDAFSFAQAAGMFFLSLGVCGAVDSLRDRPSSASGDPLPLSLAPELPNA